MVALRPLLQRRRVPLQGGVPGRAGWVIHMHKILIFTATAESLRLRSGDSAAAKSNP